MKLLKAIAWLSLIGFVVYSVTWFFVSEVPLFTSLAQLLSNPWSAGYAVFLDLLLGIVLFSIIIYLNEKSKKAAIVWIIALVALGNIVSAIYLIVNLQKIARKLKKK